RKLRLLLLLSGLGVLAVISAIFGMMMAVASDLPEIDVLDVASRPSHIYDRDHKDLGVLTGNENRLLVKSDQIAPVMKHAIVSIEDRRFYTNSGVDLRGIARAAVQDVIQKKAAQGGSTIALQLVKNRLAAQSDRTIFQKMREAAMAFHMTRKWDKERILRNYLNTIYFGNGAYGIESAARTYFGEEIGFGGVAPQCGSDTNQRRCAELLEPQQAALLAGVVANPTAYDPVTHPGAAKDRRDLVLQRMREQGYLSSDEYETAVAEPVPTRQDVHPPQQTSKYPYFTTWVRQQVVDQVGAGRAFEGGLHITTTIDGELQEAAQNAITQWLGPTPGQDGVPAGAMVVLDNKTSEVLAMVGGQDESYNTRPFNLATQGQRQPGSSFKPFTLARALSDGISPSSVWTSRKKEFCVTRKGSKCTEAFVVNNYDDAYSGVTTLANATAFSDNSVYAELGLKLKTSRIARMAHRLGIRTPVSTNYAMTLGGLKEGVTVLDMAHAYESFASGGNLIYGSLSPGASQFRAHDEHGTVPGPVGIKKITEPKDAGSSDFRSARLLNGHQAVNHTYDQRVLDDGVASSLQSILQGVVRIGSGKRAALSGVTVAGKTGTTENYGDAWFVGWSPKYTVAVWVGYPDSVKSMSPPNFSFNGEPVAGGTYPASIFATFMVAALTIHPLVDDGETTTSPVTSAPGVTAPAPTTAAPNTTEPTDEGGQAAPTTDTPAETAPDTGAAPPPDTGAEPPPDTGGADSGGATAPTP
ncbi:MAG: penicillin-binding protein, partial [Solirubrobacteraceae bacterium]|nr:penicillin-binding protein [Solirubrobacteraceae bacterium]